MINTSDLLKENQFKKNPFAIRCERVNGVESVFENDEGLFYFYVRIFIDSDSKSSADELTLDDIRYVEYKLHKSFRKRLRISDKREKKFEIKIWTYGFFNISAKIYATNGIIYEIKNGRIQFQAGAKEIAKNGADELTELAFS